MKRILKFLVDILLSFIAALFTLCISVLIALNIKSIYSYVIGKYDLLSKVDITKEMLLEDYKSLIKYLQNPFIKKLKFNNFIMSKSGEFHFYEVKNIFLGIYFIVIISMIIFLIHTLIKKHKYEKNEMLKIFNRAANILITSFGILLVVIVTNFSKAFVVFHKIFFNNDYWIFDKKTDPIIKVLPEELFKLYAIIIIALTLIFVVIFKLLFYKNKTSSKINFIKNKGLE